jgi:peptidoglycan/LPS O-acetylase OafA/YrhL
VTSGARKETATHGRVASLDGLRGVALIAAVVHHIDAERFPGGVIGPPIFFALSGFLITNRLVAEVDRTSRVDVPAFWGRRARRLMPMAWFTISAICIAALVGWWTLDQRANAAGDGAAALLQFSNWWQFAREGYLAGGLAPSPFRHFWSLSIEEQFYLVWPVGAAVSTWLATRFTHRARPLTGFTAIVWLVFLGALLATVMQRDAPDAVYLSTLTRSGEIAAGAILALEVARRGNQPPRIPAEILGLGSLGLCCYVLLAVDATEFTTRGGLFLGGIATAAMMLATLQRGVLSTILSFPPLVWLGRRSYGMYLFHWPILVALPIEWSPWKRGWITITVTAILAEAAFHLIEQPTIKRPVFRRIAPASLALTIGLIGTTAAVSPDEADTIEAQLGVTLEALPDPTLPAVEGPRECVPNSTTTTSTTTTLHPTTTNLFDPRTVIVQPDPSPLGCTPVLRVLIVGDSTARGAANALKLMNQPDIEVWDRSVEGCGFGYVGEYARCADWHLTWKREVDAIKPDVVLAYMRIPDVLGPHVAKQFDGAAETRKRAAILDEAYAVLSQQGAAVIWAIPPVPLPPFGLYYCKGDATNTSCDPDWETLWEKSLRQQVKPGQRYVIDVAQWTHDRSSTEATDRPDGLHFNPTALAEHALWLREELLTIARQLAVDRGVESR